MSSIRAEKTIARINLSDLHRNRMVVIGGDMIKTIDAVRVSNHHVDLVQINTGKECHLDANLILKSIEKLFLTKGSTVKKVTS